MKKLLSIFFVVLLVVGMNAHGAEAQEATVNEVWTAEAYCTTEAAAELLSRMMAEQGQEGYVKVMRSTEIKCLDAHLLNNVSTPQVMLVEKQWRVVGLLGRVFDFWTAMDQNGRIGYVWFLIEDEDKGGSI